MVMTSHVVHISTIGMHLCEILYYMTFFVVKMHCVSDLSGNLDQILVTCRIAID